MRREVIGDAILYCGESLELLPQVERANAVITDPPYNFSTSSSGGKYDHAANAVNSAYWFAEMLRSCGAAINYDGVVWQFLNWKTLGTIDMAAKKAETFIVSLLIWHKQNTLGTGTNIGLRPSYECVALMPFGGGCIKNRGLSDVWSMPNMSGKKETEHPAEKPVPLLTKLVHETTGATILDPFMGSGSTGVACVREGRKFIGIELDEKWFDVACKRIEAEYKQKSLEF